jgi:hypothetical protein
VATGTRVLTLVLLTACLLSFSPLSAQPPVPASPDPPPAGADPQRKEAQDVASLNVWQRPIYEQGLQMGMTHEQALTWARNQYVGGWNTDGP